MVNISVLCKYFSSGLCPRETAGRWEGDGTGSLWRAHCAGQAERVAGAGARTLLYPHSSHCSSHCSRWLAAFSAVLQWCRLQLCSVASRLQQSTRCLHTGSGPGVLLPAQLPAHWTPRAPGPGCVRQPVSASQWPRWNVQPLEPSQQQACSDITDTTTSYYVASPAHLKHSLNTETTIFSFSLDCIFLDNCNHK